MTFAFTDVWFVPAPVHDVVDVLADIEHYPRWWPQVRSIRRLDDESGDGVVRSLLPMPLHLVLTREVEDRDGGRLRVALAGDLIGHAQWRVTDTPGGSRAHFDQHVRVAARLERTATLVPWLFRANHAWMMRQGRRGLARDLTRGC